MAVYKLEQWLDNVYSQFMEKGMMWAGCLGSHAADGTRHSVSPTFMSDVKESMMLRLLDDRIDASASIKNADERLVHSFRKFNAMVGLNDVKQIMNDAASTIKASLGPVRPPIPGRGSNPNASPAATAPAPAVPAVRPLPPRFSLPGAK